MTERTRAQAGAADWPQVMVNGRMLGTITNIDPITGVPMCKDCWDGRHAKGGCLIQGCKCRCYRGRNKGKTGLVTPKGDQNMDLPDCGFIEI